MSDYDTNPDAMFVPRVVREKLERLERIETAARRWRKAILFGITDETRAAWAELGLALGEKPMTLEEAYKL